MKRISIFFIFVSFILLITGCKETSPDDDNSIETPTSFKGEILSHDEWFGKLQIKNKGEYQYDTDTIVAQVIDDVITYKSTEDLYVGMKNAVFYIDEDKEDTLSLIVIDGPIAYENIRVAIRNSIKDISDEETLYHDQIIFEPNSDIKIMTYDGETSHDIVSGTIITIEYNSGKMAVIVNNTTLFTTDKRIVLEQGDSIFDTIKVKSITRSQGTPSYEGDFEVIIKNERLLLINDVTMEQYLKKVVPSEVLSWFHVEAFKAQSIAARTYAMSDLLKKRNEKEGYHLDDSTSSQVYNNQRENSTISQAVTDTKGKVMLYGDELIDAKYYSTSSGLTASAHEVWYEPYNNETIPYLIGQNLTSDELGNLINIDQTDEDAMLTFYQTIRMKTPDIKSSFHRWKITMSFNDLQETLNENLSGRFSVNRSLVLTNVSGSWMSKSIPADIGEILNVYVEERGDSGVVLSLVIETTKAKYKIISQNNIRFAIRPTDVTLHLAKNTDTTYTSTRNGFSILPSGFFALDIVEGSVVFYGGGFGHGAGMSQYGANGLAEQGHSYEYILNTYYSDIEIKTLDSINSNEKSNDELYRQVMENEE